MSATLDARISDLARSLEFIDREHAPAALASSLSTEDMVITDAILRVRLGIEVFTLDTGRLHGDTLDLIGRIEQRYGIAPRVYRPQPQAVRKYVERFGRDAFYASTELRKRCCAIRKLEPLERALAGKKAWITGLRREQGVTRGEVQAREFDAARGMPKFNPLAEWSEHDVWAYLQRFEVPYNRLYEQGYRSIGCAPCSRPVTADEDLRAGRWWWEQPDSKECGLHVAPDGRLVRSKEVTV